MWKKYKYHISIIFFVVAIWLIEAGKPKEINWFASFSRYDKIPYGSYVLYEMLDDLFHDHITTSGEKLGKTLSGHDARNYIFINKSSRFLEPNLKIDNLGVGNDITEQSPVHSMEILFHH